MSLKDICSDLSENSEHVTKFNELKVDRDRVKFAYEICRHRFSNFNFKRALKNNQVCSNLWDLAYERFVKNQKWEGIKSVTESLAYATHVIDLTKAFGLRSKMLLSLNYRDEASADMLRILNLTDRKADEREQALSNFAETLEEKPRPQCFTGSGDTVPLDRGRSSLFESASASVRLGYSDRCERELIAENDVKTGEVLIVEKPYASVLLRSNFYTHCAHCFGRSFNLEPCSGCCFAMFCGTVCQRKSLESYHEIECCIMDILMELKVERMELLSLRLLIIASDQGKNLEELYQKIQNREDPNNRNENGNNNLRKSAPYYKSSDFMNVYNLVTNSDKRPASDLFYRCTVSAALVQLLSKHTTFFNHVPAEQRQSYEEFCAGLIFRSMQSLPCNAHEISEFTDEGLSEIGAGIYATLSLVNHSCDPNVVRHCCGDSIVLRAIKPIKKNEQIFDNYGYHYATHSLSERQSALMKQYYFKCECEACTQLWPKYEKLPKENVKFKKNADMKMYIQLTKKFEVNLANTINGKFNSGTVREFSKYLDYLDEFVLLPWQNFNNCQEALKHCWCFSGNHFRHSKAATA